jgi:hypothetical protein
MGHGLLASLLRTGGLFACLLLAACSDDSEFFAFEIPDADRNTYRLDCEPYCAAELVCMTAPEDSDCANACPGTLDKGAFQAAYLDTRFDCVTGLAAGCDQSGLDECHRQALAACQTAAGLQTFEEAWCSRWLTCNGAPVEAYLERCLSDWRAGPDRILFTCFSDPALTQLGACLAAADCALVIDQPCSTTARVCIFSHLT